MPGRRGCVRGSRMAERCSSKAMGEAHGHDVCGICAKHMLPAAGHLRRILETLGIERKPRDVTPTLEQYLAEKERQTNVIEPEDAE